MSRLSRLIREIHRRSLWQVLAVYAVVSWIALQVVDVLVDNFGLPAWLPAFALALLVIGLPIVMGTAVVQEGGPSLARGDPTLLPLQGPPQHDRPTGPGRFLTWRIAIGGGVLAFGIWGLVATALLLFGERRDGETADLATIERKSVAVLPFANLSPDPENEFFAAGIHEDILSQLAKIGNLMVISRTSVLRYADTDKPIPEIAEELGVDAVLEGSVRRAGDRVRVVTQLIDARADAHLWSETYDRELTVANVFKIQSEIAEHIAGALRGELTPEEKARIEPAPTLSLDAHDAYTRGRYEWNKRTPEALWAAVGHFQRAIELDSTFAYAYAGLADAYVLLPIYSQDVDSKLMYREAESAARRALSLDPTFAPAHASLGGVMMWQHYDWVAAERQFQRAIELSPAYATAHLWYSIVLSVTGRHDEAVAVAQRARELDPLSLVINGMFGQVLGYAGKHQAAISQCEKTLELSSDFAPAWLGLARVFLQIGRFDDARKALGRHLELDGGAADQGRRLVDLVAAYERSKRPAPVPADIEDNLGDRRGRLLMEIYALAHQKEKTLEWLERAYEERNSGLLWLKDPMYDFLREDPRFIALARRVNLYP